jgi:hypothetical protein
MPTDPLNTPAVPLSLLFLICMTLSPTPAGPHRNRRAIFQ